MTLQLSPWNPERITQPPAGPPTTLAAATSALGVATSAAITGVVAAVSQGAKQRGSELATILTEAGSAAKEAAVKNLEENKLNAAAQETALISRLPYKLLRRGNEYDVRRYPSAIFAAATSADSNGNTGGSSSESSLEGAVEAVQEYLSGSNGNKARVVPFTPSLWSCTDKAGDVDEQTGILRVPVALQQGQDAGVASAAAACPAPLKDGSSVTIMPFFGDARGLAENGPLGRGVVVAVRKLSKPKIKVLKEETAEAQSGSTLESPELVAARSALLKALEADGLQPADAGSSRSLFRATYRELMSDNDEVQREVNVPDDEAWMLLSSHDWD